MPKSKPKAAAQTPAGSPVAGQSADGFLRDLKFRIHARPAKGEAVWSRGGRLWRQSEALAVANEEWANALWAMEDSGTKW